MELKADTIRNIPPPRPALKPQHDLLVNIMAHGRALDTLKRHMPFFEEHLQGDFIIWTPQDDPIYYGAMPVQHTGFKGHDGVEALRRFRYMLRSLSEGPHERLAILEYDCVITAGWPEFPPTALAGIFFPEPHHETFKGRQFPHPPLFMRRMTCQALVRAFDRIPLNSEGGMWDRALGLAMDLAGIDPFDLHQDGRAFSHNTIHPAHYDGLREAARNGATYFHGVKDAETLRVLVNAKKE
jgi:hypothetical protein